MIRIRLADYENAHVWILMSQCLAQHKQESFKVNNVILTLNEETKPPR